MVLLVGPDTVVQLWFVTTTGLVFLVLFLALSPYRDQAAGRILLAAYISPISPLYLPISPLP